MMKLNIQKKINQIYFLSLLFVITLNIRQNNLEPTLSADYPPLNQTIKAPFLEEFRVNDQLIKSGSNENQQIFLKTVIKSGDTIDIKIKNARFQQMGFSASLQFYDKNGKIKTLTTDYAKWTCEGFIPARFSSKTFSIGDIATIGKSIDKESANEEYWCSVIVPENSPLMQKIIVDDYLTEIKVNGESLKIYDDKLLKNTVPFSFILNSKDKLEIKIRNKNENIGLGAELKYYDINGNIKTFNTEYDGWICDASAAVRYKNYNIKSDFYSITKNVDDTLRGQVYWCSVIVPNLEPLTQQFSVNDEITKIKINEKSLLVQSIKKSIPFTYPINSGDKVDITIKNKKYDMGLSGIIKYYNSKGEIKEINTNYLGWTCNGKPAIKIGSGYKNIMEIAEKEENVDENTQYDCSVIIPDKEPLLQKLKAYYYITSLKINNENIPMQSNKFLKQIPLTWVLNSGDKVDITIKNKKGKMGFCGEFSYYDSKENIKNFTTDYAEWTCDGVTPVRTNLIDLNDIKTISTKSSNANDDEIYTCSVTIPKQQPLIQRIKIMDIFINMKINGKIIKLEQYKAGKNLPFTHVLNSGDKVDITIKNTSGQMGISAILQYYDKNGNVNTFTTENSGWLCDGKVAVIYENKSYSVNNVKFIGKTSSKATANEMYTCSVVIP